MTSVQRRMASGAVWMFGARWLDKALGLVSTFVLARLLAPEDFGIVAIATAIIAFLTMLANFSFDVALVQHTSPTREHYDTVWTLGLLFGAAIATTLAALSYPVAAFYDEPRLVGVVLVLALSAFVGFVRNVGCVDFARNLQFQKDFQLAIYRRLSTLAATISLAVWLQNYWALVLGALTASVAQAWLTYAMHPFRPRPCLTHARELFGFSKWIFFSNVLQFINQRAGDFIIGKMRGSHELGIFVMANELGSLPSTELVAPINRAAFPGYARLATDREQLIRTYLRVLGIIAMIVTPAAVGLALVAPLLVPVLLGPKWIKAIELLQLLALAAGLTALWTNTAYVFLALGQPRKLLLPGVIQPLATVGFLVVFLFVDYPNGAGWAMLAAAALVSIPNFYLWRVELGVHWRRAISVLWRPMMSCLALTASVRGLWSSFEALGPPLVQLLACVFSGAATYALAITVLWWLSGKPQGPESFVLELLTKRR